MSRRGRKEETLEASKLVHSIFGQLRKNLRIAPDLGVRTFRLLGTL